MKFRLEMKNFGQSEIPYDPQRLTVNGSTQVRDSEERLVPYIGGSFQTGISLPLPTLAPSKSTVLCDEFDLNSQYLIVKPGVYTVQSGKHCPEWLSLMRAHGIGEEKAQAMSSKEVRDQLKKIAADVEAAGGEFLPLELVVWEAIIPASKRVTIEVRPGTVPPERRVAARLLDILPKTWALNLRQLPPNRVTPPGWEAGHGMFSVAFDGYAGPYKEHRVGVRLWIGDRKLRWNGKVEQPGQRAAIYLGKCMDGYVYADLPSVVEAAAAGWPGEAVGRSSIRSKVEKTLQIVSGDPGSPIATKTGL